MNFTDFGMLIVAVLSLGVALIATMHAKNASDAAQEQVDVQRQIAQDDAQPYVWADVRPSVTNGSNLMLYVGNSGKTLATNIRIEIDRMLPTVGSTANELLKDAIDRFSDGHASLAPGRELSWGLGFGGKILENKDEDLRFTFVINAEGPFGPIPELKYLIDMNDWRGASAIVPGTMQQVSRAIKDMTTSVDKLGAAIRKGHE
ncbi:hypothetical protein [Glutamicibacter ardleyensis]|uniref:hypothetical protein n=1 Tax=Glutamicibacter ardleyensis TaxID=225894 RepID=UPI003FD092C9